MNGPAQHMVETEMVVEDGPLVIGIASKRHPLRKLPLEIGIGSDLQGGQQRRFKRYVAGTQSLASVADRQVSLKHETDLEQIAIKYKRFGPQFHIAKSGGAVVDDRIDHEIREVEKEAETLGGDFLIHAKLAVTELLLDGRRALAAVAAALG